MRREGGAVARVRAAPPGRVAALIPEVAGRLGGQAAFEHGFDHLGEEAAIPGQRELAGVGAGHHVIEQPGAPAATTATAGGPCSFEIIRHRAKTLGGLLTRPTAKVVAYTVGQVLNAGFDSPSLGGLVLASPSLPPPSGDA